MLSSTPPGRAGRRSVGCTNHPRRGMTGVLEVEYGSGRLSGGVPRRRRPAAVRRHHGGLASTKGHGGSRGGGPDGLRRTVRAVRRRQVHLRRDHFTRAAVRDPFPGDRRTSGSPGCSGDDRRAAPERRAVSAWRRSLLAWAVAQWDYVLPQTLTVAEAAAPTGTIVSPGRDRGSCRPADPAGLRPALRPRPEGPSARGEAWRPGQAQSVDAWPDSVRDAAHRPRASNT